MKIFITSTKEIFKTTVFVLLILISLISVINIKPSIVAVFTPQRQLPIYYVGRDDNKIAITINCAWGDGDIDNILSILKDHNVRASFFIVGDFAERYPARVKQISDAGHEIGSHGYRHVRMGEITKEKIMADLDKNKQLLEGITGKPVNLFRPPFGDYNDTVMTTTNEKNYYTIQWSVDSLDWKPDISMDQIKARVEKNVKSGSIVLFHNDTKYTASVLDSILTTVEKKGFLPVSLSELIYIENYTIENDGKQVENKVSSTNPR